MSYIIVKGGSATIEGDDVCMDVIGDDEGHVMLFAHRIDAEDYADWLDEAVELHVVEAPADMTGVVIL